MRDRLIAELGAVRYEGFLVYLMGPYTTFEVTDLLPDETDPESVSLPSAQADSKAIDEMQRRLRRVQGSLRADPGINAFLAIDANVPLEEMNAATQSIKLARASNAVVFIVPQLGDNLGVGMEIGSVLEDRYPDGADRTLLAHEAGISSAMLGGVTTRWNARITPYDDETDLIDEIRNFVVEIMTREQFGDLEPK
ncbi:hypothetical protein I7X12_07695 [Halosimplex litoreum]|uniref:DUF7509 domain-containing protein n=2 Tax=Halosimplex litoreum TaxID=1198301 RepID=A0A7U3WBR6_9EURY|nr:hypothetical protein I7X12_07695 [Halosimplex litoreum]